MSTLVLFIQLLYCVILSYFPLLQTLKQNDLFNIARTDTNLMRQMKAKPPPPQLLKNGIFALLLIPGPLIQHKYYFLFLYIFTFLVWSLMKAYYFEDVAPKKKKQFFILLTINQLTKQDNIYVLKIVYLLRSILPYCAVPVSKLFNQFKFLSR